MTNPNPSPSLPEPCAAPNSVPEGASYRVSIAADGSNAHASPAPGVAGAGRRQEAPAGSDGAEGGLHPEQQEEQHECRRSSCEHACAVPLKPRVKQRERLRDDDKRMHQPSCRMNDTEYQRLALGAAACGMSIAAFLARAGLNAARDLDRTAAEVAGEREMVNELFALRRHLGQIGNNLNQVAQAANSGADALHATAVLDAVERAAQRVDAFTQQYLGNENRSG